MEKSEIIQLPISLIEENDGQIPGVHANPRSIDEKKYEKLKESICKNPEFLQYNTLKVFKYNEKYVAIGGNMRLRALKELSFEEVPCVEIDSSTSAEKLNGYILLDNASFGEWKWEALDASWGVDFTDFGFDTSYVMKNMDIDSFFDKPSDETPKNDDCEENPDEGMERGDVEGTFSVVVTVPSQYKESEEEIRAAISDVLSNYEGVELL